jgi:uncharacterized RDD family membrane protein YckC
MQIFIITMTLSPFASECKVLSRGKCFDNLLQDLKNAPNALGALMVDYAGFGVRFVAVFVDGVIMFIPSILLGVPTHGLASLLLYFLYKSIWEASAAQATPGKRAMGVMVTNLQGGRLDLRSSLIRSVVSLLSASCLCLGHVLALFTEKHQSAHDLMAESVVVRGDTQPPLLESWLETAREVFGKSAKNI